MNDVYMELFGKATSLAKDLLDTDAGRAYTKARETFEANEEAMNILQNYGEKVQAFQIKSQDIQDQAELEADQAELSSLIEEMQRNSLISDFFQAEEVFHRFVAQIMDVFNATIIGQKFDTGAGCGCGSGGGCCGGAYEDDDCGPGCGCGCN